MQNSIKFQRVLCHAKARFRICGWRSVVGLSRGATTKIGCYGLAPVLKVSDDKIDYNRANFVSFCCFLLL